MKRVIRGCCFETNSSSMHSIVISKSGHEITKEELDKSIYGSKIRFWDSDDMNFGRYPFRVLTDLEGKLQYVIASRCPYMKSEEERIGFVHELESIIREVLPDFKSIDLPVEFHGRWLDKDGNVLNNFSLINKDGDFFYKDGEELIRAVSDGLQEETQWVYVDHQSIGVLDSFLKDHNVSLKEFLLNSKYIVIIDGDEYRIFNKMAEAGLINRGNIEGYEFDSWR